MRIILAFLMLIIELGCRSQLTVMPSSSQGASASPEIFTLNHYNAREGDTVSITGLYLTEGMSVQIGDEIVPISLTSVNTGSFVVPPLKSSGPQNALFISKEQSKITAKALLLEKDDASTPIMEIDSALVCAGIKYRSLDGTLKQGGRNCDGDAVLCAKDGDIGCRANADFPAIYRGIVNSERNHFSRKLSIAGVAGELDDCGSDGDADCIMDSPDLLAAQINGAASKIMQGQTAAGIMGTVLASPVTCSAEGEIACVSNPSFRAADLASISANNIKSGSVIAGVSGTLLNAASPCGSDGQSSCITIAAFPALVAAGASAKIMAGQSLGGISGAVAVAPSSCNSDGQSGCVTTSQFPAVDKVNTLLANTSKMRASLTLAGVTGDLPNCSVDGDHSCFVFGPTLAAADTSGAAAKIMTGQSVAGISGTAPLRPANCALDGATDCVTLANFPSVDKSFITANAAKLRSSMSAGGVAGTLPDCSTDNETDCVASNSFPSVLKTTVTAGVLKSGEIVAGVTGAYPSASYPLAGNTAATDLTSFISQLTSDGAFEFFDSAGNRYAGSGDSDIRASNLKTSVVLENFGITGILPTTLARAPSPMTASYTPTQILLNWQNTGAAGYLLVRHTKGPVDFIPSPNQSYSTGAQGNNTILQVGSGTSYTDTAISTSQSYSYAVYAYDANHYYSSTAATAVQMLSLCSSLGSGWVAVPGDLSQGTSDFCVMKYEAKDVSGVATSQAASAPWASINQTDAQSKCQSLGSNFDLISNAQWLTIAGNIASVPKNWSKGSVGSGYLNKGHTDNNPTSACAASSDDSLGWVQSNCTPLGSSGDVWAQRRTFNLSTNEVIWDIGGNVFEWTSYIMPDKSIKPYPSTIGFAEANYREFFLIDSGFTYLAQQELLPRNRQKSYWDDNWGNAEYLGAYNAGTVNSGGSIIRGASWTTTGNSGILTLLLYRDSTYTATNVGFRCVAHY